MDSDKTTQTSLPDDDPTAEERKRDHIELAFRSQIERQALDQRFSYEPLLAAHPQDGSLPTIDFCGKQMQAPIWVSSMTGGTELAATINQNLAKACQEFGLGMGLGSCRPLLYSDERLGDFDIRHLMGDDAPLFVNLGIAQLEGLLQSNEMWRVKNMIAKLRADGLIIHVNPFQEWLQPEGDRFLQSPLETIEACLQQLPEFAIIIKEVGQGMGPASMRALLQLPVAAIDFAANGGTNFSKLELLRSDALRQMVYEPLALVGESAEDMVETSNQLVQELGDKVRCQQLIISGGIRTFLDGYYLINKVNIPAIYGQASEFLRYARGEYADLRTYVEAQVRGLELAQAYLRVK